MKKEKHIIWSNYFLDYDDWKVDLKEQYPDLSEDERISLMYEINSDYLGDERMNLNIQLDRPISVIGDLGSWNGRRSGYKEIESGNIRDCACMPIRITAPGTWISWATCDATPFIMTASTTISTVPIKMA